MTAMENRYTFFAEQADIARNKSCEGESACSTFTFGDRDPCVPFGHAMECEGSDMEFTKTSYLDLEDFAIHLMPIPVHGNIYVVAGIRNNHRRITFVARTQRVHIQ
jgi:hypothetical protein